MKLKVKVDNEIFEVEIKDLSARPVCVDVDGEQFEVFLDPELVALEGTTGRKFSVDGQKSTVASSTRQEFAPTTLAFAQEKLVPQASGNSSNCVYAPIPGVIASIAVQPGESVEAGQALCVLEAMKMNNSIRANRTGVVAKVHVTVGQHVKHHDMLIEYQE